MEPVKALKPGHYTAVKTEPKRKCADCKTPLSIYNRTAKCSPCTHKEFE